MREVTYNIYNQQMTYISWIYKSFLQSILEDPQLNNKMGKKGYYSTEKKQMFMKRIKKDALRHK